MFSLRRCFLGKRSVYSLSRNISRTSVLLEESSRLSGATHKVNNLEKKFLVWTGKYKTVEEVPTYVAPEAVERARNRMRIRISNVMIVLTAVICFFIIKNGQKAREEGDSLTKRNLEWHKAIKDEAEKEKNKEKP